MNKNILWKLIFIILLAALAAWQVYPPKQKLKQGLDLAGGTSLVYEIDTTGLNADERKGLAESMIPILLKRIDPTHMANLVMRPQGDTRIEIQLPLSSLETRQKRKAYEAALEKLESTNVNLLQIKRKLSLPKDERQAALAEYARGNEQRLENLQTLASVYDLRSAQQKIRDEAYQKMEEIADHVSEMGVDKDALLSSAAGWAGQTVQDRTKAVENFLKYQFRDESSPADISKMQLSGEQKAAIQPLLEYTQKYEQWAKAANKLTGTPTDPGLNEQWQQAVDKLSDINISIESLRDILDLPNESVTRTDRLAELKTNYPDRAELIDQVTTAFDEYRVIGGHLDDPEDLKRMLKGAGVLEFRILPTQGGGELSPTEIKAYLEALESKGPKQASDNRYIWCEVEDPAKWTYNGITGNFGEKLYVLASNQTNETMLHSREKEWKLRRAFPDRDQNGRRAIGFSFDQTGASIFYGITSRNIGKPLCILLDDLAISSPNINSAIGANGIITGSFTPTEQTDMVNKLNAGSFRAKLSDVPISEKTIGATIGGDNRDKGIRAGLIGLAAVALFMLLYYWLAGSVADIALLLNILFILAAMSFLSATFTLPGIAGLILTIGMSVDANVLIFERIREEQKRGSSLKAAIANGYNRALSTILDANITTFGVAFILLMVASEEIKGFAIVLMLGIASSMFTALFATRVMFDFLISRQIITNHIKMFGIMQNTKVNWMALRPIFLTISSLLIIGGMTVFFTRNEETNSKYDIEFTGGTSAIITLKEGTGMQRQDVEQRFRDHAQSIGSKALAAARVNSVGENSNQFEITTTETNKTTATVRLPQSANQTIESVTQAILKASNELGQTMSNLQVTSAGDKAFQVSTSRVNKSMVQEVLTKAFGPDAVISDIVVNEVVSDAIRTAFEGLLNVWQDLQPEIVSIEKIGSGVPELAEYDGGIEIHVKLNSEVTLDNLYERFQTIRFKQDMQNLTWYRFELLSPDLSQLEPGEPIREFIYVSVPPEAGYRDFSETEWKRYVENERSKVVEAASLESSLARVTQIDPSIGEQAKVRALLAIFLSLVAIVGYIWIRFGTARYGVAAIAALVHDVCITLGLVTACSYIAGTPLGQALGIGDFKINLEMIAAFLTIIGYSLNDTIVVFDRIRENRGKLTSLTPGLINNSVNQTLSRTILTSFTTFLVVLIMYIWGGTGLRGFTFAMLIGILVGTYSSIAIASPILLLGSKSESGQPSV